MQQQLDWAEEEERKDQESAASAKKPGIEPAPVKSKPLTDEQWAAKHLADAKEEFGEDFGEDIVEEFK